MIPMPEHRLDRRSSLAAACLAVVFTCACSSATEPTSTPRDTAQAGGSGGATHVSDAAAATGGTTEETGGAPSVEPTMDAASVEMDAASEAEPDSAPSSESGTTLPPGDRHVLMVWGQDVSAAPHDGMLMLLQSMKDEYGVVVDEIEDVKATADSTIGKALVVINPSTKAYSGSVQGKFKNVPVPVIISKDHVQQDMDVAAGSNDHSDAAQTQITIVAEGDPMAAGLTGTVTVYPAKSRIIFADMLSPDAKRIAVVPGHTDQVCIYTFEKGATMANGFVAPARRAGFFWHRPTDTTPEGKQLLRALVAWMLASPP
jgi:hypothetical protein